MNILLRISHHYELVSLPAGMVPTQQDIDDKIVLPSGDETVLDANGNIVRIPRFKMRVKLAMPDQINELPVSIPESQLESYMTPNRDGTHKMTRAQVILHHLNRTVLASDVGRTDQEHIVGIEVDGDEPEPSRTQIENFLKVYFNVGGR